VWSPRLEISACIARSELPGCLLGSQVSSQLVLGMTLWVTTVLLGS
jgi:hypothetical protein